MKFAKKIEQVQKRLAKIANGASKKPKHLTYFTELLQVFEAGKLPTSTATILEPTDKKAKKKVLNVLNAVTVDYAVLEKLKKISNGNFENL